MRDVLPALRDWYAAGQPFALATVVGVSRSAPRQPGAVLAVAGDGEVVGSVSGGCVEGAVVELGEQVLATGEPVLHTFGYSDDDAFAVGLTCGGEISVFVEPAGAAARPELDAVLAAVAAGEPVALATVIDGPAAHGAKLAVWPDRAPGTPGTGIPGTGTPGTGTLGTGTLGTLGTEGLDVAVSADARGMLSQGQTGQRHYGPRGERRVDDVTVFVESFAPPPRMLVFGAIDFAAAVARAGAFLGYRVTVCDARPVFATAKRFPAAHEVVVEWPHRFLARTPVDGRTVICVLTHDPKFDVPLLEVALRTDAAYVGAMGSRRTCAERLDLLRERGMTEAELARLRAPIGLDLGARTPEETAVSVAAEIIAARWDGSGRPLGATAGAIHQANT